MCVCMLCMYVCIFLLLCVRGQLSGRSRCVLGANKCARGAFSANKNAKSITTRNQIQGAQTQIRNRIQVHAMWELKGRKTLKEIQHASTNQNSAIKNEDEEDFRPDVYAQLLAGVGFGLEDEVEDLDEERPDIQVHTCFLFCALAESKGARNKTRCFR